MSEDDPHYLTTDSLGKQELIMNIPPVSVGVNPF